MTADPQRPVPQTIECQIEGICSAFRASWTADGPSSLEPFLFRIAPQWRMVLEARLQELQRGLQQQAKPSCLAELSPQDPLAGNSGLLNAEHGQDVDDRGPTTFSVASPLHSSRVQATVAGDAVTRPLEKRESVPSTPTVIGRYRVEGLLGRGGFGVVYVASDDQLERRVAIKVPHAELVARPEHLQLYLREARTVASLEHPHIVPVYDVGSAAGFPFFVVSRFIEGVTLAARVRASSLTIVQAADTVATIADALHYAHKQGVVHRDIKPGNILIDSGGKPYVVDFGLALRERGVPRNLRYAGTPSYMSPEQARGEGHHVDGRSDIFSLGVVLYELLTGQRPFYGCNESEILEMVTAVEPKPLRQVDDQIPRELERICLRALTKRVADRYSTARDLCEELREFLHSCEAATVDRPGQRGLQAAVGAPPVTPFTPVSDTGVPKVVPKGLRSFDELDADFYLELLPGARDRDGLPDSIRFWRSRIGQLDAEKTFSVGLLYGPSGCGKTSFVKAGLLPRLPPHVTVVYSEAAAAGTEQALLKAVQKKVPGLSTADSLPDVLSAVRRGEAIDEGHKLLIVVDQFEQWLQANEPVARSPLVQALRQCDGERVQCLLLVRDDFWLSVSRLFRAIEIPLVDGHNTLMLDLFDVDHAQRVLALFGTALMRLPTSKRQVTREQSQFLRRAVEELAFNGRVVPVHLALFADMMKTRPWTPGSLREVGGAVGLGVTFLEESFSLPTASPAHRLHQRAARAALAALLPERGSAIKGHMLSSEALQRASGYRNQRDFEELIRILNEEVRLIRATEPADRTTESSPDRSAVRPAYFQLTHDYLVPVINEWLTRRMGLVARLKRWCRQRPEAPALLAGGYTCLVTAALVLWALFGILHFWYGVSDSTRPEKAVAELALITILVYLPMFLIGWRTTQGDLRFMWLSTFALFINSVMLLLSCFGLAWDGLQLEAMVAMRSPDAKFQIYSLMSVLVLIGLVIHVWALVATYAWHGSRRSMG